LRSLVPVVFSFAEFAQNGRRAAHVAEFDARTRVWIGFSLLTVVAALAGTVVYFIGEAAGLPSSAAVLVGLVGAGIVNGVGGKILHGVFSTEMVSDAISSLGIVAEQLASGANQLAANSRNSAQGAAEQAIFLEQTSESIERISGMTKQTAESAREASTLSDSTVDAARGGDRVLGEMNEVMHAAQESAYDETVDAADAVLAGAPPTPGTTRVVRVGQSRSEGAKSAADLIPLEDEELTL